MADEELKRTIPQSQQVPDGAFPPIRGAFETTMHDAHLLDWRTANSCANGDEQAFDAKACSVWQVNQVK